MAKGVLDPKRLTKLIEDEARSEPDEDPKDAAARRAEIKTLLPRVAENAGSRLALKDALEYAASQSKSNSASVVRLNLILVQNLRDAIVELDQLIENADATSGMQTIVITVGTTTGLGAAGAALYVVADALTAGGFSAVVLTTTGFTMYKKLQLQRKRSEWNRDKSHYSALIELLDGKPK